MKFISLNNILYRHHPYVAHNVAANTTYTLPKVCLPNLNVFFIFVCFFFTSLLGSICLFFHFTYLVNKLESKTLEKLETTTSATAAEAASTAKNNLKSKQHFYLFPRHRHTTTLHPCRRPETVYRNCKIS